ncbi:MAG: hypothetical protein BWY78_01291 [Alphaproteobacteria bacterium ADurb.Bin438]|nr:MAG: hypothetical protein BWY78_01291 [Alphaproteobacteria bacterium ADurb.Bin438]
MENQNYELVQAMIKLFRLPYSKINEISKIETMLKEVLIERPRNATIAISLLQAKVMLGKVEEAINLAENIWSVGGDISKKTESLYISLLNSLCMFNYSKVMLDNKLNLNFEERVAIPDITNLFITCYTGLGDINSLMKVAHFEETGDKKEFLKDFCHQMIANKSKDHFAFQQNKIHSVIFGKCSSYETLLTNENQKTEIEIGIFSGGSSVNRYQLQKQIDKVYNDYYETVNHSPIDNFLITVYDIKEHWGFDGSMDE